jgi:hypothetical protein
MIMASARWRAGDWAATGPPAGTDGDDALLTAIEIGYAFDGARFATGMGARWWRR